MVIGKKINDMEKECSHSWTRMAMNMIIMENGKMIRSTEKEVILLDGIAIVMKDNGKIIIRMDLE